MERIIRVALVVTASWFLGASASFGATKTAESEGIRATVEYADRVAHGDKLSFVLTLEGVDRAGNGLAVSFRLPSDELFGQFLASEIVSPGGVKVPDGGVTVLRFDNISTINATLNKKYHFEFRAYEAPIDSIGADIRLIAEVDVIRSMNTTVVVWGLLLVIIVGFPVIWYVGRWRESTRSS